jgi:hypothetical protein
MQDTFALQGHENDLSCSFFICQSVVGPLLIFGLDFKHDKNIIVLRSGGLGLIGERLTPLTKRLDYPFSTHLE